MFFAKVPVQTNSCNQNLCNDSWIPSHFWVLYAGNPSTIWLTVLSVSNRARLSLQLFWNHQIFRHIFEIGAFIHFDLERGNYPPPIGWFDFLSFFLYSKLHQKLKSIFIKRRNKKKITKKKTSECEDPKCPLADCNVNLSRDALRTETVTDTLEKNKKESQKNLELRTNGAFITHK